MGLAVMTLALPGFTHAQPRFPQSDVSRGAYLATAGDCGACHNAPAPGGALMAGGLPIVSPLGTLYASNITPSRTHGIGNYTEAQFAAALRKGIRADGARLYPAMPYTAYAGLTDQDVHALYAYFMQGVAPVDHSPPETRLPFPFNIRASMIGWDMLFLKSGRLADDPAHDPQWNHGRYLAQTLGHCSTCHSPRGLLMQERQDGALSGSPLGAWYAPNITSDKLSGIGSWQQAEIAQYLATGHVPGKAQAAGEMANAVTHSFSRMTPTDIDAIAAYIATVPSVPDANVKKAAFAWGTVSGFEARLRGAATPPEGARLYSGLCASCHGSNGGGSADGNIPSLFHNSTVGNLHPANLIATILQGVDRTVGAKHVLMPSFGDQSFVQSLSDEQIAQVATFVRQNFGPGDTVSSAQVALARQGGKASLLGPVIRGGLLIGALALLIAGVVALRLRRRPMNAGTRS